MKGKKLENQHNCVLDSPIGKLGIIVTRNQITKIDFLPANAPPVAVGSRVIRSAVANLKKYFYNPKLRLSLILNSSAFLGGTVLQKKIWRALQKIPCGKTITYGELAKKIKTGPRVIGNACRANPLPIIIPCHRVVAATSLGGYCGKNKKLLKIKKWLLKHEGANSRCK